MTRVPHALIVEDEEDNRRVVVNLVKAEGHTLSEADCLEAARELLNNEDFDYVLLDLKIPLGPGDVIMRDHGDRLLKEIREHPRNQNAGVVVITSTEDRDLAVEKMRLGASDYIWKPLQEQTRNLASCIGEALRHRDRLRNQSFAQSKGLQPFRGATIRFADDKVYLDDEVLCISTAIKQKAVLRYLAANQSESPTADMMASDLGYNVGNNGGSASVHKAISNMRCKARELFESKGISLSNNELICNRRAGSGYEIGSLIQIEGLAPPAQKAARKK